MAYQVLNIKKSSVMGKAESDEHQRNWTREQLHRQNQKPRNFYDPTRQHVNFEIDSNGRVQPINTSPSITKRMEDRCQALGSKPPKKGGTKPRIRLVKFIVSGDTDLMRKLAFGDQDVDYSWNENKVANIGLERKKEIEQWAKDVYDFFVKEYGKENVVGFDCHLDENSPHLHVAIVPVYRNAEVNYSAVFGDDKWVGADYRRQLHSNLHKEVSSKWGMERGEDTTGRNVYHREKGEHYAELNRLIRTAEKKLKSLQTMIANIEDDITTKQTELADVERQLNNGSGDLDALAQRKAELENDITSLETKRTDKQEKISKANMELAELKEQVRHEKASVLNAEQRLDEIQKEIAKDGGPMVRSAMLDAVYPSVKSMFANPEVMKQLVDDGSMLDGLDDDAIKEIHKVALALFMDGIMGGTPASIGTGGGGSESDLKWRDDDEDETFARFARRCLNHSIKSYKANKKTMKR